jgi:hypothetical protein
MPLHADMVRKWDSNNDPNKLIYKGNSSSEKIRDHLTHARAELLHGFVGKLSCLAARCERRPHVIIQRATDR